MEKETLDKMSIFDRLLYIQSRLIVTKNKDAYGKFMYRTNESILEALKPLLIEAGCVIRQTDKIVNIGDRYYVESSSNIFCDSNSNSVMGAVSLAREPATKKGMDESQITGAASSYARKYSLCGLFAIDDNKDADDQRKKDDAFTEKVEKALSDFMETSDKFTTIEQWDSAMQKIITNRENKNKIANDERFYDPVFAQYKKIAEIWEVKE